MRKALWTLGTLGVAILCTGAGKQAQVSTFSTLPTNEVLSIQYESSGCFRQIQRTLEYRRSPKPVLKVLKKAGDAPLVVRLTPKEVEGLDALLRFYRSERPSGCTTVDTVTITQIRGGKPMVTEQFVDSSCRSGSVSGAVTLDTLIQRAEPSTGR